jgi:hypothetical protein
LPAYVPDGSLSRLDDRRITRFAIPAVNDHRSAPSPARVPTAEAFKPRVADDDSWVSDLVTALCNGLLNMVGSTISAIFTALGTYLTDGSAACAKFVASSVGQQDTGSAVLYFFQHFWGAVSSTLDNLLSIHIDLLTKIAGSSTTIALPLWTIFGYITSALCDALQVLHGTQMCPDTTLLGLI